MSKTRTIFFLILIVKKGFIKLLKLIKKINCYLVIQKSVVLKLIV